MTQPQVSVRNPRRRTRLVDSPSDTREQSKWCTAEVRWCIDPYNHWNQRQRGRNRTNQRTCFRHACGAPAAPGGEISAVGSRFKWLEAGATLTAMVRSIVWLGILVLAGMSEQAQ